MRAIALILLVAAAAHCSAFHETFSEGWEKRWIHSDDDKYAGKFDVDTPLKELADPALKVTEKAKHYGISASLPEPVDPAKGPLVLQFDVKLADGLSCGGAYLKFVTADKTFTPSGLKDDTPYTVMFGPDKCGATNKVHLILRHTNQKTKKTEEKHLRFTPSVVDDSLSHVYTAILDPTDNTYNVLIDGESSKNGSLFEDFEPPFVPSKEIDDPEDKKPADWVDEAKISDPDAKKPADWDEDAPEYIPDEDATKPEGWLDDEPTEIDDPEASKPEDWDDEEDGDWEAPRIPNPKCADAPGCGEWTRPTKPNPDYKGKWSAPLIDNPAYKGIWKPRKIANPEFYNDTEPLSHIGAVGAVAIEIWTMDENYYFDNVVVTDSAEEAATIRETTWAPKFAIEKAEQEKKEAEEKAKAEAEAAAADSFMNKLKERVTSVVEAVLEYPALAPVTSKIPANVKDALIGNPMAIIAAISAIVALVLTPMVTKSVNKQAEAVKVAQAKKNDDKKPAASPAKKAAAAKKDEIEEEDEEEEEEEAKGGATRRRARRD